MVNLLLLPPANEVCKGYVFTGVRLSSGGGGRAWQGVYMAGGHAWQGVCMAWGACVAGGCAWQGGHAWWGVHAPPLLANTTRYSDTINEWAVRILLECILVPY